MLLLALGSVALAMRHLGKPSTARQLGHLFSPQAAATDLQPAAQRSPIAEGPLLVEPVDASPRAGVDQADHKQTSPAGLQVAEQVAGLSQVRDKTYFRPAEQEAWLNLFSRLQSTEGKMPLEAPVRAVTYAQLLKQPQVYRGRMVTIRGTVLREEVQPAAKNRLGIKSYHRLWVSPLGGGQSPFVVYCLELPSTFPRGDKLRCGAAVTGYFFKNWSFAWDEGLALAPTILANSFSWESPVVSAAPQPPSRRMVLVALGGTCFFGLALAWIVSHSSQRRRRGPAQVGNRLVLPDDWEVPDSIRPGARQAAEDENGP